MKAVFKAYKILSTLYFIILIFGLMLPTSIRYNIFKTFEILSSEGSTGMIVGAILISFSVLVFWFVPQTLIKLLSTKGNLKKFWNEV
tara:strand:- start:1126 stop:1386 length:261 start_codon:yes stop_codon:yes gene_type:complete